MEIISTILILSISILVLYIAYQDIITRKVKNTSLMMLFIVSLFYFIFSYPHSLLIYFTFILLTIVSFIFYTTNIWGAADGKFFIISSLAVLGNQQIIHIFQYLFNIVFIFTLGSFIIGVLVMKPKKKYALLKSLPYKLHLFQAMIILAITTLIIQLLQNITNNIYLIFSLVIIVVLILNYGAKKLYYKLEQDEIIVIGFSAFSAGIYQLLPLYIQSLIVLIIIKAILFYGTNFATRGMDTKKYGFAPPFVTYMAIALIIQLLINQTILLYILEVF